MERRKTHVATLTLCTGLLYTAATLGCGKPARQTPPRPDARARSCANCKAARPDAAVARVQPPRKPDAAVPAKPSGPLPVPLKPLLGGQLAQVRRHANAAMTSVRHVQFSRDGKTLALGLDYGHLTLWRFQGDKPKQITHRKVLDSIHALAISPDGKTLVVAGTQYERLRRRSHSHGGRRSRAARAPRRRQFDAVIRLYATQSGDLQRTVYQQRDGSVVDLAFTVDGQHLVSSHRPRRVAAWLRLRQQQRRPVPKATFRIWSTATWKQDRTVSGPVNGTPSLALLDKGARIAYPHLSAIKVLDTKKERITRTVRAHRAGPRVEDSRPDESFLTLAVPFNRVSQLIRWDPRRVRPRKRFRFAKDEAGACGAFVGTQLTLGGANWRQSSGAPARGLLRLWDQRTGRLRRHLKDLPFSINDCSATDDGLLAMGGRHLIRPGRSTGTVLLLSTTALLSSRPR